MNKRIIKFTPAYDKRSDNPKKNYGIGSMSIRFILEGKEGAVQVVLNTPFFLPETVEEYKKIGNKNKTQPSDLRDDYKGKPRGFDCWDVGFHSKKKLSYMSKEDENECDILGKCYYDGSSLRGMNDKVAELFMEKGEEFIWNYLEDYYMEVFGKEITVSKEKLGGNKK